MSWPDALFARGEDPVRVQGVLDQFVEASTESSRKKLGVNRASGLLCSLQPSQGKFWLDELLRRAPDSLRPDGSEPIQIDSVEDSCLAYQLSLLGPITFRSAPLVAYRITEKSLSADHVKSFSRWVKVFELLQPKFEAGNDALVQRVAVPDLDRRGAADRAGQQRLHLVALEPHVRVRAGLRPGRLARGGLVRERRGVQPRPDRGGGPRCE